uniref:Uncharacterized protein n=1 Tax=Mycena chlorophos TaxID=658473 RepID=A0ABQ0LMG5_MYCCL|nr:predicted protein [Mycena chlorophos]
MLSKIVQADIVDDPGGRRRMIPKRATTTETGFLTIVFTTTQVAPTTFVETIQETDVLTATGTFSESDEAIPSTIETTFLTFVTRTQTALETHTSVGLSVVPFTLNDVAAGETTASSQTTSASASSTTSSTASPPPTGPPTSAGTIAGAVLATLAVLGACVGAALFLFNRRRCRRRRGDGSEAAATGFGSEALASWSKPAPLVVMNPGGEISSLIMPVSGGGGAVTKEKAGTPQEDPDALRNEIYALRSEVLTLRLEARAAKSQNQNQSRYSRSSGAETSFGFGVPAAGDFCVLVWCTTVARGQSHRSFLVSHSTQHVTTGRPSAFGCSSSTHSGYNTSWPTCFEAWLCEYKGVLMPVSVATYPSSFFPSFALSSSALCSLSSSGAYAGSSAFVVSYTKAHRKSEASIMVSERAPQPLALTETTTLTRVSTQVFTQTFAHTELVDGTVAIAGFETVTTTRVGVATDVETILVSSSQSESETVSRSPSSTTTTPSSSFLSETTAAPASATTSTHGGISTNILVGAIMASLVGLAVCIGLAVFLCIRRRRRRNAYRFSIDNWGTPEARLRQSEMLVAIPRPLVFSAASGTRSVGPVPAHAAAEALARERLGRKLERGLVVAGASARANDEAT